MRYFSFIILFFIWGIQTYSQAQNKFPISKEIISVNGDTLLVNEVLSDKKPKLFFFWFTGCTGCKISLDQTLIHQYIFWEAKYGVKIVAISGDKETNRDKAIEFFKSYPFDLYFDINNELFDLMPKTPWKGKTIKAYPALVYVDETLNFVSINPWDSSEIEKSFRMQ